MKVAVVLVVLALTGCASQKPLPVADTILPPAETVPPVLTVPPPFTMVPPVLTVP